MFQICVPTKNSRKKTNITFLKHFLNAMIRNIKIHNILILMGFQNIWSLINLFIKKYLWKCLFKYFLWFFKVWWVQENQSVTFLVVPPKDMLAFRVGVLKKTQKNNSMIFKLVLHMTNLSKRGKKIVHTNIIHVVMIFHMLQYCTSIFRFLFKY